MKNAAMQNDWIDEYSKGKEEKYNRQNELYAAMRLCELNVLVFNRSIECRESFICSMSVSWVLHSIDDPLSSSFSFSSFFQRSPLVVFVCQCSNADRLTQLDVIAPFAPFPCRISIRFLVHFLPLTAHFSAFSWFTAPIAPFHCCTSVCDVSASVHACVYHSPSHLLPYFIASDFIFVASASSVSSLLFLSFFRSFFMQLSTNCIKPIRSRICIIVLSLSVLLFSCPCHCRLFKFTCFPHKSVNCSPPHSPHNAFTSIPNFLHSLFVCFSPPSLPPSICVNCVPPAACSPSCNRSADLYMRHPPFCILPCLLHCLQAENSQNIKKTKKKKRWMHNRRNQSRLKKNRERRMHRTNRIRLWLFPDSAWLRVNGRKRVKEVKAWLIVSSNHKHEGTNEQHAHFSCIWGRLRNIATMKKWRNEMWSSMVQYFVLSSVEAPSFPIPPPSAIPWQQT